MENVQELHHSVETATESLHVETAIMMTELSVAMNATVQPMDQEVVTALSSMLVPVVDSGTRMIFMPGVLVAVTLRSMEEDVQEYPQSVMTAIDMSHVLKDVLIVPLIRPISHLFQSDFNHGQ